MAFQPWLLARRLALGMPALIVGAIGVAAMGLPATPFALWWLALGATGALSAWLWTAPRTATALGAAIFGVLSFTLGALLGTPVVSALLFSFAGVTVPASDGHTMVLLVVYPPGALAFAAGAALLLLLGRRPSVAAAG